MVFDKFFRSLRPAAPICCCHSAGRGLSILLYLVQQLYSMLILCSAMLHSFLQLSEWERALHARSMASFSNFCSNMKRRNISISHDKAKDTGWILSKLTSQITQKRQRQFHCQDYTAHFVSFNVCAFSFVVVFKSWNALKISSFPGFWSVFVWVPSCLFPLIFHRTLCIWRERILIAFSSDRNLPSSEQRPVIYFQRRLFSHCLLQKSSTHLTRVL